MRGGFHIQDSEKNISLLKPYTRFEKIQHLSIDEMAESLYKFLNCEEEQPYECDYCKHRHTTPPYCRGNISKDCIEALKIYLKGKAE